MNYRGLRYAFYLSLIVGPLAAPATEPAGELATHMQRMLTDGDHWRTPNPDYDPTAGGPLAFGLRFGLAPDGSHATGTLSGIFADGREATYWSLLAFYNPVTQKVVTKQVGWNGALLEGAVPVQGGPVQIVDMIHYNPDGSLMTSRHENRFRDDGSHVSLVHEPDQKGGWAQKQSWTWQRHDDVDGAADAPAKAAPTPGALAQSAGFLVEGDGRWRAENPDYDPDGDAGRYYGMNFRWGPHGQHIVGEIISIFDDGTTEKHWSLYLTYNPVTHTAILEQTGASGVYFRGEMRVDGDDRRTQTGLVYLPNGNARSVRDEIDIVDDRTYVSRVFERDEAGGWRLARTWTWRRQEID